MYVGDVILPTMFAACHIDTLVLLQVLVINCATNNPANVALWRPLTTTQQQQQQPDSQQQPQDQQQQQPAGNANSSSSSSSSVCGSWLPWVLQVRSNPSSGLVEVLQADTREGVEALAAQGTCVVVLMCCVHCRL